MQGDITSGEYYLEDISEVIFEQYYALLEQAIEEANFDEIENYWQKSFKLGSRGVQLRSLIEKESNRLGLGLLTQHPTFYLTFLGRNRGLDKDPLTYKEVRLLWHASNISNYLKLGQYSNAYSYAIFHEQEDSFLKIPALVLGVYLKEQALGTYLYFYAKCCLAVNREKGERINIILDLQNRMTRDGLKIETVKNLMRNVEDNHDVDVKEFLFQALQGKWLKEFESYV